MGRYDDDASAGEYALGCLVILLIIPVSIFMRGWALTMMWGWFVVPFGIMQIGMAHALGLSSCIALFHGINTGSGDKKDDSKDTPAKTVGKMIATAIIVPLLIVGIGWIIHQFM